MLTSWSRWRGIVDPHRIPRAYVALARNDGTEMICHTHEFIFVHTPKAAGTSILAVLREQLGENAQLNDQNPELIASLPQRERDWPNHCPLRCIRDFLGRDRFEQYFKFTFVRNPFERLVSQYFYTRQREPELFAQEGIEVPAWNAKIMRSESLAKWVMSAARLGNPQSDLIVDENGELLIDFVGRTERAETDFAHVCERIGIEPTPLPRMNATEHGDYRQYYDEASRDKVANHFRKDLRLFGYTFD